MSTKLVILLLASVLLVVLQSSTAEPRLRDRLSKRKVGQLEITTTPLEYMQHVRDSIADEEGKPKDLLSTPTSVWCFQDKGEIICMPVMHDDHAILMYKLYSRLSIEPARLFT